jgi:hypothetical protein
MKLYTEEHMSVAINAAKANPEQSYLILALLKPIEIPSNEEIQKVGREHQLGGYEWQNEKRKSFIEGANWMRDKLTLKNED